MGRREDNEPGQDRAWDGNRGEEAQPGEHAGVGGVAGDRRFLLLLLFFFGSFS